MLTELDNCVLGVVWRQGPMSAYGVRSHFAQSNTVAWSSSTGTIYPSIRRLILAGLLDASERSGPRKTQLLAVTRAGMGALREWLTDVRPELGSATADPLRTRLHFLAALGTKERARAFQQYRAATKAKVEELESLVAQRGGTGLERSEWLGNLGALMEVKARLAWLDLVEPEIRALERASPDWG
jgi:DNA-binding PadR family transcriptional regulator